MTCVMSFLACVIVVSEAYVCMCFCLFSSLMKKYFSKLEYYGGGRNTLSYMYT